MLFAAGTFSTLGLLDPVLLFALLTIAAIFGDAINYWIGSVIGSRAFEKKNRFLNRKHLEKTQNFYKKYGGNTIVIARFVPIVRTFAPFVAGVGTMNYTRFAFYNINGAFIWTSLFVFGGYFFGIISVVRHNFEIVIMSIIFLSVLSMMIEYIPERNSRILVKTNSKEAA